MEIDTKREKLDRIYNDHAEASLPFVTASICREGCLFCCTHYGTLDVITLEALLIRRWLGDRKKGIQHDLWKKIRRNMKEKEAGKPALCPFLNENHLCMIYRLRPFSCRQLYSLEPCAKRGPVIHRKAMELTQQTVTQLQNLDDNGYSGHISYMLHLIDSAGFRKRYLANEFRPAEIRQFAQTHKIRINRLTR